MTDEWEQTLAGMRRDAENCAPLVGLRSEDVLDLLAEYDACREVLRRVEWSPPPRLRWGDRPACPLCEQPEGDGHAPGCALKARIS